jgi:hypothetical protein
LIAKLSWLSRKNSLKAYGSMVVYVTRRADAARLLGGQYFDVDGESAFPDATNWTSRESEDAQKVDARATDKAPHAAKAWFTSEPKAKAKVSGGKARRQKEQRSPAKVGRNVAEQPIQEGLGEFDDMSDDQEGEEDEEEEDNAGEDDAGEDGDLEEEAGEDDAGKDRDLNEEAVVDDENGHDAEEQDGDGYNKASKETETGQASEREDEEHEGEEDLAENVGNEGEQEAEGQLEAEEQQEAERQREAERQQEAAREGESEGEEKTGEETEPHSETRGKDCAVHDGEEEKHGDDGNWGRNREIMAKCKRI